MLDKENIKLKRYYKLLRSDNILIGESIDWCKTGKHSKRELLKSKGIDIQLVKKSYLNYFYKDTGLFKGNIVMVTFNRKINDKSLIRLLENLELDLGILPIFFINEDRVISISYLKKLLQNGNGPFIGYIANNLVNVISNFSIMNKVGIQVISKIKKE